LTTFIDHRCCPDREELTPIRMPGARARCNSQRTLPER